MNKYTIKILLDNENDKYNPESIFELTADMEPADISIITRDIFNTLQDSTPIASKRGTEVKQQ